MPKTETTDERLDRELIELQLRVALPGVQMLFGFLLALPFSVGFEDTTAGDRRVYFASFLAAAASVLIAPSADHVAATPVACWYGLPLARRLQG